VYVQAIFSNTGKSPSGSFRYCIRLFVACPGLFFSVLYRRLWSSCNSLIERLYKARPLPFRLLWKLACRSGGSFGTASGIPLTENFETHRTGIGKRVEVHVVKRDSFVQERNNSTAGNEGSMKSIVHNSFLVDQACVASMNMICEARSKQLYTMHIVRSFLDYIFKLIPFILQEDPQLEWLPSMASVQVQMFQCLSGSHC
jgi:hypothetical protein